MKARSVAPPENGESDKNGENGRKRLEQIPFKCAVSGVSEVSGAFSGREAVEECTDSGPLGFEGAGGGFAQHRLQFGEDLLDRTVGRQVEQECANLLDGASDSLALVGAKVVDDDNVAGLQSGKQDLLDIGLEG